VLEPLRDRGSNQAPRPRRPLGDDPHCRLDQVRVAFVEQINAQRSTSNERSINLVIESQHGRRASRCMTRRQASSPSRSWRSRKRSSFALRHAVHDEGRARDHAERALGTDEELHEVRAYRLARGSPPSFNRLATGEHDTQSTHDVFDLSVAIGVLAGAATGDPSADGRQFEGLGEVSDRPARLGDCSLQVGPKTPARHSRCPTPYRCRDAIETGHVERDGALGATAPPTTLSVRPGRSPRRDV